MTWEFLKMLQQVQLSNYKLLEVSGDEAHKFLQGSLPTNLNKLQPGQHTFSCSTNHQGKVIGTFRLLMVAENLYWLFAQDQEIERVHKHLASFAIFNRVTWSYPKKQIVACFAGANPLVANYQQLEDNTSVTEQQILILKVNDQLSFVIAEQLQLEASKSFEKFHFSQLLLGYPRVIEEITGEFLAQALGLEQLEAALAFNKGCYQGQEAIARAKYRGSNRRSYQVFSVVNHDELQFNTTDLESLILTQISLILDSQRTKETGLIVDYSLVDNSLLIAVVINNYELDNSYYLGYHGQQLELQPVYSSKQLETAD